MIPLCFRRMHHVFYHYTIEPQEYVKNFVYFILRTKKPQSAGCGFFVMKGRQA